MAHGILFFNIVDVSCLAAHIIFKSKFPNHPLSENDSRSHFIKAVASGLAQAQLVRRQEITKLSPYLKETISISITNLDQDKPRQTKKGLPQLSSPQSESKDGSKSKSNKMTKSPSAASLETTHKTRKQQHRCRICPWKKDKKVTTTCSKCRGFVCGEHRHFVCSGCMNAHNVTSY